MYLCLSVVGVYTRTSESVFIHTHTLVQFVLLQIGHCSRSACGVSYTTQNVGLANFTGLMKLQERFVTAAIKGNVCCAHFSRFKPGVSYSMQHTHTHTHTHTDSLWCLSEHTHTVHGVCLNTHTYSLWCVWFWSSSCRICKY